MHSERSDSLEYLNQLEPSQLIQQFSSNPPDQFHSLRLPQGVPGFAADFDLLTTAEPAVKRNIERVPLYRYWSRALRIRTAFIGTTVSEYALFPANRDAASWLKPLCEQLGNDYWLTIIKDIPQQSPLLDGSSNEQADHLMAACEELGFIMIEGQALAYVPINFSSLDEYLAQLSAGRRRDIRRKWRSREALTIRQVATGDAQFDDEALIDSYYSLYLNVYQQSEIHFDRLSRAFFAGVLRNPQNGGIIFEYHYGETLIGYNLCFVHRNNLVDKYIGLRYPEARTHNLYFISWLMNLDYARSQGLKYYVAGWTDPEIKSYLGASFTFTRHAVYIRNGFLRRLLRRFSSLFESDRHWSDQHEQTHGSGS